MVLFCRWLSHFKLCQMLDIPDISNCRMWYLIWNPWQSCKLLFLLFVCVSVLQSLYLLFFYFQYFLRYGPCFELEISEGNRPDCNSKEYIESCISTITGMTQIVRNWSHARSHWRGRIGSKCILVSSIVQHEDLFHKASLCKALETNTGITW